MIDINDAYQVHHCKPIEYFRFPFIKVLLTLNIDSGGYKYDDCINSDFKNILPDPIQLASFCLSV